MDKKFIIGLSMSVISVFLFFVGISQFNILLMLICFVLFFVGVIIGCFSDDNIVKVTKNKDSDTKVEVQTPKKERLYNKSWGKNK